MVGKLARMIEGWERLLRLDRFDSASDLFKARTVYITMVVFLILETFNSVQMFVAYGGWTLDHTLLIAAMGLLGGLTATLRWHANFDLFAIAWGSVMLIGIMGTAMPHNIGINTALLPALVAGIVLIALLGSLRSLLTYCACVLLMVVALHINAGAADLSQLSDPAYVATRNLQRSLHGLADLFLEDAV
jgi:hypothetical protein